MAKTNLFKSKEMMIPLNEIARHNEIIDPLMMNVRRETSYNRPEQIISLRDIGMQVPLEAVKCSPNQVSNPLRKYILVKGFSRRESLEVNNTDYPNGYTLPDGTVRRFDKVAVKVYEIDDIKDIVMLKVDHSEHKGLTKVETFITYRQLSEIKADKMEKVMKLAESLNGFTKKNPPKAPSPKNDDGSLKSPQAYKLERDEWEKKLEKHHRGTFLNWDRVLKCPIVFQRQYELKLEGLSQWPTNDEIMSSMQKFEAEVVADTTAFVNKDTPGPIWNAWFEQMKADKAKAETDDGSSHGVSAAPMTEKQIRDSMADACPLLKRILQWEVRDIRHEYGPVLFKITARVSEHLTEEEKAILSSMLPTDKPAPKVQKAAEEAAE